MIDCVSSACSACSAGGAGSACSAACQVVLGCVVRNVTVMCEGEPVL